MSDNNRNMSDDFIVVDKLTEDKTRNPVSRYRKDKKLKMKSGILANETVRRRFIRDTDEDRYVRVMPEEEHRIDLVAMKAYNDVRLWWVIAVANDLEDPTILDVGKVLRIPSLLSLYGRAGVLS